MVFSEFPIGSSVPFNTNVTFSIHALHGVEAFPETLLRQAAATLLGGVAPDQACSTPQEVRLSTPWLSSDCRYEQVTGARRVPIRARLAIAIDSQQGRCMLMTATALETEFSRYETLFTQLRTSFHWTNGELPQNR